MTVVLLHALPLDERMWAGVPGFAPRLYERGRSMDEWARSVLDQVDGDLVLVGTSMGGYCSLAIARLAPGRVAGLALVGSRPEADTPDRRAARAATLETIRERGAAGLWGEMRDNLFPGTADPAVVERAAAIALEQKPGGLAAAVEAIRDRQDSTEVWRGLDAPTLVVVGDHDPFIPVEDARGFAHDGALHVFEGTGHLPGLERPAEFREVLDAFVERVRMSDLPFVVDADWLEAHLGEPDLFVGDVRGPNAHARGHIPGSKPLVLGSPPPGTEEAVLTELAGEVGLRLRRHGLTGEERLVLVDRGDGVGAMPAAQMAELAGHPAVAVLLGGIAGWPGALEVGQVELAKSRATFEPRLDAMPTREELSRRLGELELLDVRSEEEYEGHGGYPCDPRQGHIPGARRIGLEELLAGPGQPFAAERIREVVGLPEATEVVAYCHSGSRSALAALALRSAGYRARNYPGSWHEWSRHEELPAEGEGPRSPFKRLLGR